MNKNKFKLVGLLLMFVSLFGSAPVFATTYTYQYPYQVVTTPPPAPTIAVSLSASLASLSYPSQTDTTLLWTTTGSPDTCTGTDGYGSWPGGKDPSSNGLHQEVSSGLVPGVYSYKMICVKGTEVANASVMVVVTNSSPSVSVILTASPNQVNSGMTTNLSWTSTNATSCITGSGPWLNPGSRSINSTSPEVTGPITANTTFEIKCKDDTGPYVSAWETVYLNNPKVPVVQFIANPSIVDSGQSSTLSWLTQNATSCVASSGPWSGSKSVPSGSEGTGALTAVTTYGITCSNSFGSATAYATVFINIVDDPNPPTISYFQPYSCVAGGSSFGNKPKFAWDSTYANSCTITRLTAPTASQSVGVSAQASGGSLEFDGLYYYLTNLAVVGNTSTYKLQCSNTVGTVEQYAAVNVCSPDFTLSATPILRSFVNGTNPGTGNPGKLATYTISVNPISGFSSPVDLSVQSYPQMPASTSFTFSSNTVSFNGASYETSVLTIGIDNSDFPIALNSISGKNLTAQIIDDGGAVSGLNTPTVYTPIIIQGDGGGFTHTVTIGADATGKKRPVYIER